MARLLTPAAAPGYLVSHSRVLRPDLRVTLIEPLLRRSIFLTQTVDELGMADRVGVVRSRAEDHRQTYDVVVARALAPLDRLIGWCNPLRAPGGVILALKGSSAADELAAAKYELEAAQLDAEVLRFALILMRSRQPRYASAPGLVASDGRAVEAVGGGRNNLRCLKRRQPPSASGLANHNVVTAAPRPPTATARVPPSRPQHCCGRPDDSNRGRRLQERTLLVVWARMPAQRLSDCYFVAERSGRFDACTAGCGDSGDT